MSSRTVALAIAVRAAAERNRLHSLGNPPGRRPRCRRRRSRWRLRKWRRSTRRPNTSPRSTPLRSTLDPAAGRWPDHANLREVRRTRRRGRPRSCRSIPGVSRPPYQPGSRTQARKPTSPSPGGRHRPASFKAGAINRQELEPAQTALQTAEANWRRCRRRSSSNRSSCATTRLRRRPPAGRRVSAWATWSRRKPC